MKAVAEVLGSSISGFVAELWSTKEAGDQRQLPSIHFGSVVRAENKEQGLNIYGIVYDIVCQPQDGLHKPTALQMTRQKLKEEQPQIFQLLKTELRAQTIGYQRSGKGDKFYSELPPLPPQIHDFVFIPLEADIINLTEDLGFLRLLVGVNQVPPEELISACLSEAIRFRQNDYDFMLKAGRELARIYRDDYDLLLSLLNKLQDKHPDAVSFSRRT